MPLPERGVALQARSKTFTEVALFVFYWVSLSAYMYTSLTSFSPSLCLSVSLFSLFSRSDYLSVARSLPLTLPLYICPSVLSGTLFLCLPLSI
jgi:hypothetical protein